MLNATDDVRIDHLRPLLPPAILMEELPLPEDSAELVAITRKKVGDIIAGRDDRIVVVVGPCSVHDPAAAIDYASRLKEARASLGGELEIVMRVYFEKPRTTVGWKGLINDPQLDGSFNINAGLREARRLLCQIVGAGVPAGTEFLDPITPQFIADLVSWGAIGARTTESQVHRELASGLSMPVGFKNGTGGSVQIAVDAVNAARHPHRFLSVTKQGLAAIVATRGNQDSHVILRGGSGGPNFSEEHVTEVVNTLEAAGLSPRVMVDCSHANSSKDPTKQPVVAEVIAKQVEASPNGIAGVMIESFLVAGRQNHTPGCDLVYGQSITDACLAWEDTLVILNRLSEAVKARRSRS